MPLTFSQVAARIGKSGIAFLVAVALFFVCYFLGQGGLAFLVALVLVPLSFILLLRAIRLLRTRGLWSVRNRLLFVYSLIGILPLLLVIVLIGLGAWALTNELAIYLATSALNSRLSSIQYAVEGLRRIPTEHRMQAANEIAKGYGDSLPGLRLYVRDATGVHRAPDSSPDMTVPPGWGNVNGLIVSGGRFYGWAHFADSTQEIYAMAPLSDQVVENLVPNLGAISLFETDENRNQDSKKSPPAGAGTLNAAYGESGKDPNFNFSLGESSGSANRANRPRLPPAAFRFDIPVLWPSTLSHFHLERPNKTYRTVLWIYSRPSIVLGKFFSGTEFLRGALFNIVISVAVLFLLVELVAVLVGAKLARRLTGAINALYEGTRRIINGDFKHRIPIHANDQLGELAGSFNQMTGNLERLLVVEKEKERLQTELEIAREVQGALYPKKAPPTCGLKLSVQCDPARMVSGDYYDYQELAGKRLAFAIGDVAGKGISAALLMATLQAALRAQMTQYQPVHANECRNEPEINVAQLVSALNKQIFAHTSPEKYATFFFALFDERSRALTYTNAGHLSPLLFRNGDVTPLDSNGTVVGAFPFSNYEESCLIMTPGDLLVCYTDGITEPENPYGEEFGETRLIDLVNKHSHRDDSEIIHIVLDAVRDWTGSPELHDDMTLMLAAKCNEDPDSRSDA